MEIFDIYDSSGRVTGRTAVKGTACTGDDYYLGVHVYIYNEKGQFLIQKRAENKAFMPGEWEILLEHTIASENGIDTAVRGVREELGLSYGQEKFKFIARIIRRDFNHITDVFFLEANIDIDHVNIQTQELSQLKWISKEEMLCMVKKMQNYRPKEYVENIYAHIEGMELPA